MCGICGIIRLREEVKQDEIESMKRVLIHRGPDDEGTFISPVKFSHGLGYIGLGHRRLSIIDLSQAAKQPMCNEDGQIWLTYNGEIYNFQELRNELISFGHIFKTKSDSEVILHGYEQWGIRCVDRFNGMFAFAVWDVTKKILFLVRDRLGIKPLYYYTDDGVFVFASELKSILQIQSVPRKLNYRSFNDFLSLQYVPTPNSIFNGIKKLSQGSYLIFDGFTLRKQKYWDLNKYVPDNKRRSINFYQEEIKHLLTDAVRKRMISDVPLGGFLSGGMDSSSIVGLMANSSITPVKTFSIGFNCDSYRSELKFARISANVFKTDHHEDILNINKLIELLPKLVWHMDEPFADHSMIPTFLISRLAKENVTVCLSGDGADENFGGYPRRYLFAKYYTLYNRVPKFMKKLCEKMLFSGINVTLSLLPSGHHKRRVEKLKDVLCVNGIYRSLVLDAIISDSLKHKILHRDICGYLDHVEEVTILDDELVKSTNYLEQVLKLDIKNYLIDDILTKVDRMSMGNSLEVRVPMLDHRLVELAATIPTSLKIAGNQTKHILKEAMKNFLPEMIIKRPKQGFGLPIQFWMQEDLIDFSAEILLDDRTRRRRIINVDFLERMIKWTRLRKDNFGIQLWMLLVFELWCREFLD